MPRTLRLRARRRSARHDAELLRPHPVSPRRAPTAQRTATGEGVTERRFDFDSGVTVSNRGLNAPLDIVSFNTDVSAKRDPCHTTRAGGDDLRGAAIRELFR